MFMTDLQFIQQSQWPKPSRYRHESLMALLTGCLPIAALLASLLTIVLAASDAVGSIENAVRTFLFWTVVFVPVIMLSEFLFPRPLPPKPLQVPVQASNSQADH